MADGFAPPPPKGPLSYEHACLEGCPAAAPETGNVVEVKETTNVTTPGVGEVFPGFPLPQEVKTVKVMLQGSTGPNGEQIFYHPHMPELKAEICKGLKFLGLFGLKDNRVVKVLRLMSLLYQIL